MWSGLVGRGREGAGRDGKILGVFSNPRQSGGNGVGRSTCGDSRCSFFRSVCNGGSGNKYSGVKYDALIVIKLVI